MAHMASWSILIEEAGLDPIEVAKRARDLALDPQNSRWQITDDDYVTLVDLNQQTIIEVKPRKRVALAEDAHSSASSAYRRPDGEAMTYAFAVLSADLANSINHADEVVEKLYMNTESRPSATVSAFLYELDERYGIGREDSLLSVANPPNSYGAIIHTRYAERNNSLYALLNLTMNRGLAVFDTQLSRLYNPCGLINVQVLVAEDGKLPYLTRELLEDLVRRPDPESPFLIVEREDQEYIQTMLTEDGFYLVEYRDGGPDSHYGIRTQDSGLVTGVIWAWTAGDASWRTAVPWRAVEFDVEDSSGQGEATTSGDDKNEEAKS